MTGLGRKKALTGAVAAVLAGATLAKPGAALAGTPAAPASPVSPLGVTNHHVQVYKLETVEISGSSRMTSGQLSEELGLVPGTPLDDDLVMSTRQKLLGLGLFKSAILVMRRGTKPGYARLIVEVEDDGSVLSDWALGGELDVWLDQANVPASVATTGAGTTPMDYRLSLVGRNLFGALHRGAAMVDVDSGGNLREAQIAYGLPRFTQEGVQFDAQLAVVDPFYDYLDALGFGGRGQGLWSRTLSGSGGEIQYGAAMYTNRGGRFNLPGFPDAVAGPKIAYFHETRLRGFFPGEGHLVSASLLASPTQFDQSVLELEMARTFTFQSFVYWTLDASALSVGVHGGAVRAETRLDVPFGHAEPGEDQAEAFIRLRGGHDAMSTTNLDGSAAMLGVRYHSSGFIAELAVEFTRQPTQPPKPKLAPTSNGQTGLEGL